MSFVTCPVWEKFRKLEKGPGFPPTNHQFVFRTVPSHQLNTFSGGRGGGALSPSNFLSVQKALWRNDGQEKDLTRNDKFCSLSLAFRFLGCGQTVWIPNWFFRDPVFYVWNVASSFSPDVNKHTEQVGVRFGRLKVLTGCGMPKITVGIIRDLKIPVTATAEKTSLKKWLCVLSIYIAITPSQ